MIFLILGTGYVGQALLAKLQGSTDLFYASTTTEEKRLRLCALGHKAVLLRGNEKERIRQMIERCDGALVLVAPKEIKEYEETYLETALSLSAALEKRKRPFTLVYTSSTSVYEGQTAEWAYESSLLNPPSLQGALLKQTEEIYLNCASHLVTTSLLRLGGIYGPGRELHKRAERFSGKEMASSGEEPTNHIHLDDITSALIFCLRHRLNGLYNLVNDDHPTRKELYAKLCASLQIPPPLWKGERKGGYKVANHKIKESGFLFTHPHLD